jgi:hypothetical protein
MQLLHIQNLTSRAGGEGKVKAGLYQPFPTIFWLANDMTNVI